MLLSQVCWVRASKTCDPLTFMLKAWIRRISFKYKKKKGPFLRRVWSASPQLKYYVYSIKVVLQNLRFVVQLFQVVIQGSWKKSWDEHQETEIKKPPILFYKRDVRNSHMILFLLTTVSVTKETVDFPTSNKKPLISQIVTWTMMSNNY